ncbi:unnamed protein product [Calypogeia fissa]
MTETGDLESEEPQIQDLLPSPERDHAEQYNYKTAMERHPALISSKPWLVSSNSESPSLQCESSVSVNRDLCPYQGSELFMLDLAGGAPASVEAMCKNAKS